MKNVVPWQENDVSLPPLKVKDLGLTSFHAFLMHFVREAFVAAKTVTLKCLTAHANISWSMVLSVLTAKRAMTAYTLFVKIKMRMQ